MNVLHCLENLYAVIRPSASQVNTKHARRDFSAILKSRARSRGRVSTNQTSENEICVVPLDTGNLKKNAICDDDEEKSTET